MHGEFEWNCIEWICNFGNSHKFGLEFEWTYECGLVKLIEIGFECLNFELKTLVCGCNGWLLGNWKLIV